MLDMLERRSECSASSRSGGAELVVQSPERLLLFALGLLFLAREQLLKVGDDLS